MDESQNLYWMNTMDECFNGLGLGFFLVFWFEMLAMVGGVEQSC
jgi:hypothetical protein